MMNELRDIMGNLTDIECGMECVESVLNALQEHYEYKQENEAFANVIVFMGQISGLRRGLAEEITRLDTFILSENKRVSAKR